MTTSSGNVGIDLHEKVAFDAPQFGTASASHNNQIVTNQPRAVNSLTEFMYQTTAGSLGEGVRAQERSKLSQRMDKLTLTKVRPEEVLPKAIDIRAITAARDEHPMYVTSYRDIGAEKAQLKVEIERLGRPNTFTNSFNGFRYRDFGLNTAVTKSRICDQLDNS
ncbi:hypothetical protein BBJ28_00013911 [Nothophytophthora sp. Chile5]|nr:hypothetical protein BBJ28_00013911 [Nothophytophthora sp. Chile5]